MTLQSDPTSGPATRGLRIAVSGSSGLVGSSLVPALKNGGHETLSLVRRATRASGEVRWEPKTGEVDAAALGRVDAVVHLAGAGIADRRWTAERKALIRSSRVEATEALCQRLTRLDPRPSLLVCASAVGYYGDRGNELLDESSPRGEGFLADVVEGWEAATAPAREAGIRVVSTRFGMILSPEGGALARMLTPFRLGLGGPLGDGEQYVSWVTIDDVGGAIQHALAQADLAGPINVVAPSPVQQREFARVLGRVLKRPAFLPMPAFAARLVFGELADELLLAGQRVQPRDLQRGGFRFEHPELEGALRHVLGR